MCHTLVERIECLCGAKVLEHDKVCRACGRPKWAINDEKKRRSGGADERAGLENRRPG